LAASFAGRRAAFFADFFPDFFADLRTVFREPVRAAFFAGLLAVFLAAFLAVFLAAFVAVFFALFLAVFLALFLGALRVGVVEDRAGRAAAGAPSRVAGVAAGSVGWVGAAVGGGYSIGSGSIQPDPDQPISI